VTDPLPSSASTVTACSVSTPAAIGANTRAPTSCSGSATRVSQVRASASGTSSLIEASRARASPVALPATSIIVPLSLPFATATNATPLASTAPSVLGASILRALAAP
jgi:hypothetical protein